MFKEFKEFIMRGSVIDLAVGIIIGAAFKEIVDSFVADILMPPISLLTGGIDFVNKFVVLKEGTPAGPYTTIANAKAAGAVTLNYGAFIMHIIMFLIIAFVVFLLIRQVNNLRKQKEGAAKQNLPSREEELLTEIRDLMKSQVKG